MSRFCKNGHDTLVVGRTPSRRCRECKRIADRKQPEIRLPIPTRGEYRTMTFDIENRPLSYWLEDRPTAEVTAIAWSFDNPRKIEVVLLGRETLMEMLTRFLIAYNMADMVTGHYIRKHDLPILNGAMIEQGLSPLSPKLTLDTKLDMVKKADIPATQEYLSEVLGIAPHKVHMTQAQWREANRLTDKGTRLSEKRVVGDVVQHMALRRAMLDAGWLKSPRVWRP